MRTMVSWAHIIVCAAVSAVGAAPGVVENGLLASYNLLRADCVNGTFPESAGAGGSLGRTGSTRCLDGPGVSADGNSPRVTGGATALRDALGASAVDGSDGLTVELWLRLDAVGDSSEEQPIFSISAPDATDDSYLDNVGLRICAYQDSLLLDMLFRGESPYDDTSDTQTEWWKKSISDVIGDISGGNVSHLVISIGQYIEVFVDGTSVYDKNFMADYQYDTFLAAEAWADTFTNLSC